MRPKKDVNEVALLKMREEGKTQQEISKEMGVSIPTISRRLAVLHREKGILTKYRQLQGLQLTELQARILEKVDLKNFEDASLIDLLSTFKVLKKMEIVIEGQSSSTYKIKSLIEHLLFIEKVEQFCAQQGNDPTTL